MKVALLGGGSLGNEYAQSLCELDNVEVTGVCDVRAEAANKLASLCRSIAYGSYEEMMANTEPDIVCVCLPTYVQKEYILKAIDHGKHVICEAPLAATSAEAEDIMTAADAKGVKIFIGIAERFSPYYRNLKDKIAKGSIGSVGVTHIQHSGPSPRGCENWYNDESTSKGIIQQRLIHDIFLMRWILGEVRSVYAMQRTVSGIDYAVVTLRLETGGIVNLAAHWGDPEPYRCRIEAAGNKGVIRYDSRNTNSFELKKQQGSANTITAECPMLHSPYFYQLEHFLDCIRLGTDSQVAVKDVHQALKIAEAATRSVLTGMPVPWGGMNHG
ncbi:MULTISPECIES: Gfo/Idh/MocA family protein [unclassified Paenibacillus]|uniref:Gfo/Idh/MocA family protein n=1 Tax=unclassified Paenibacillus TaxID=185978 RepID=UPI00364129A0